MDRSNGVDRHAAAVAALRDAVLHTEGDSDAATRLAAFRGSALPPQLADYVAKVHGASQRIGDRDIAGLLAQGYSQDALFELTVAAALGAALDRLEAGMAALQALDR